MVTSLKAAAAAITAGVGEHGLADAVDVELAVVAAASLPTVVDDGPATEVDNDPATVVDGVEVDGVVPVLLVPLEHAVSTPNSAATAPT